MPTEFEEVDGACPACGLKGVWMCTSPGCPMKEGQKTVRDRWQERQNNPSGDESGAQ